MAGKRKEKLTAFNRGNILESACQLFQEKGIAGTTMDDIAGTAEYSKTTIYCYFNGKKDLVNHLVFEGMEMFKNKLGEESEKSGDFADFYERFCALVSENHDKHPIYYEGLSGPVSCDSNTPADDICKKIYISGEEADQIAEEKMVRAVKAKEIAMDDDMRATMMFMWFCVMGIIEKTAAKEGYITLRTGKTKAEFLDFAFKKLFRLLETEKSNTETRHNQQA